MAAGDLESQFRDTVSRFIDSLPAARQGYAKHVIYSWCASVVDVHAEDFRRAYWREYYAEHRNQLNEHRRERRRQRVRQTFGNLPSQ